MREIALLQLMHARGLGPRNLLKLLHKLHSDNYPIQEFINAPKSEMVEVYNLKEEIVESIHKEFDKASQLVDNLYEFDIKIIDIFSPEFPERLIKVLGDTTPPILFTKGDTTILNKKAVGFCGSRKASVGGCEITQLSAGLLAKSDVNIVSGYAHGIDSAAHNAALQVGGVTTIVLAMGILQFKLKSMFNEFIDENNILIISEFVPLLGWIARNAMIRNRTICGLSDAMFVIEAGESGGTFEAGLISIKLNQPLFVIDYENSTESALGNKFLIKKGGIPIRSNKHRVPNLEKLFNIINNNIGSNQTSLF